MTAEKEFTLFCIKCGKPETDFQQDSRGCEFFKEVNEMGQTFKDIFLCSECIGKFQFFTDLPQIQREAYQHYSEKYMPIIDALFKVQSELQKINDQDYVPKDGKG
jgi:hypothetical protein